MTLLQHLKWTPCKRTTRGNSKTGHKVRRVVLNTNSMFTSPQPHNPILSMGTKRQRQLVANFHETTALAWFRQSSAEWRDSRSNIIPRQHRSRTASYTTYKPSIRPRQIVYNNYIDKGSSGLHGHLDGQVVYGLIACVGRTTQIFLWCNSERKCSSNHKKTTGGQEKYNLNSSN